MCFLLFSFFLCSVAASVVNVEDAAILCNGNDLACSVLANNVFERAQKRWPFVTSCRSFDFCVLLGASNSSSEGYSMSFSKGELQILGESRIGLLFGVGKLLRSLNLSIVRQFNAAAKRTMLLDISLLSLGELFEPMVPVRAVKVGYKAGGSANTCWWSTEEVERLAVELIVFGMNELSFDAQDSSRIDDDSPCFRQSVESFIAKASQIAAKYGVAFSLWIPPVYLDNLTPQLSSLEKLDRLYLASGDPGSVGPREMLEIVLPKAHALLGKFNSSVQLLVSSQEYDASNQDLFFELLKNRSWPLLGGIFYGPHTRIPLDVYASRLPENVPLMSYPDICHGLKAQFPK